MDSVEHAAGRLRCLRERPQAYSTQ